MTRSVRQCSTECVQDERVGGGQPGPRGARRGQRRAQQGAAARPAAAAAAAW